MHTPAKKEVPRSLRLLSHLVAPFAPSLRSGVRYGPLFVRRFCLLIMKPFLSWHTDRPFTSKMLPGFLLTGRTRDLIGGYCYLFGIWEPSITAWIARRLQPGDTFVDLGANIGYYTLLAARLVPEGHVVAVEPSPRIGAVLKRNIELNRASNVRVIQMALSDRPGTIAIYQGPDGNDGMSHTIDTRPLHSFGFPETTLEAEVPAGRLIDILTEAELAEARVVKIDIEGAELQLIESLEQWLPKARREIEFIIELHPRRHRKLGNDFYLLVDVFLRAGFRMYNIANAYGIDALLSRNVVQPVEIDRTSLEDSGELDLVFSRLDDVIGG